LIMKVLVWNINGATESSDAWKYISKHSPDVALLQEVGSIPHNITKEYNITSVSAVRRTGGSQRFSTVVMAKNSEVQLNPLTSNIKWVNKCLELYRGNLVSVRITINGTTYNLVSVYSPAWQIDTTQIAPEQQCEIKLESNAKIFLTEILWASLKDTMKPNEHWLVGGDFNSSETFDKDWQQANAVRYGLQSSGNREIIDRMNNLGLRDVVREHHGEIVPTYKAVRGNDFLHQMDHLYVSSPVLASLEACSVGDHSLILEQKLSDHLPIESTFNT